VRKYACVTPGRVERVTISWARAVVGQHDIHKTESNTAFLDINMAAAIASSKRINKIVCYFFTDLYATALLTPNRSWPCQSAYSGILITVRLRVDKEDNWLVGNFFYRGQHIAGGQWAIAAIDHHDAFLGNDKASRRSGRVGSKNVDAIFHFRKPCSEILSPDNERKSERHQPDK